MDAYVHDAALDMLAARNELTAALGRIGERDWDRYVPYGDRTLHELLAHLAGADGAWAQAAQGLLRGEAEQRPPLTPTEARAARDRAIERGRDATPAALIEEMARRRRLLLSLYELLEPRHLAIALRSFGERHNSVRERIWRGYHDRLHAAAIARTLRMRWHPQRLRFPPDLAPAAEALAPDATLYVAFSVDPVQWERPSPLPGWSYRQLLAHIASGDWVLQAHLSHIIEHAAVMPWPDIDAGNAARIAERAYTPAPALIEEYLSMRHETLQLIARLEPRHLDLAIELWWEPPPNRHSVRDYIAGFGQHDRAHREQLRGAMRYARAAARA